MPRAGLSRPVVGRAAADLADEIGFERLTLAALASRLGVAVPSLYKHVPGLDALRRDIAILALGELADRISVAVEAVAGTDRAGDAGPQTGAAAEPGPAGASAALRAMAAAYRAYATDHPGRYAATVRAAEPDDAAHGAAAGHVLDIVFDLLRERGLAGDAAIDATRSLRAGLHGFISLEAAGGFGMPRDVDRSFDRLVSILDAGLRPDPAVDAAPPRTSS
jgi:AcrR family transcriptional regulator